jgi:surfeit locus 1 family protein
MKILFAMFTRKWVIATMLVLIGSAVCIRLGIWQLDRLAQRRVFNAHYLETTTLSPLIIDADPKVDLTTMEYRIITVMGVYDPVDQVVLRNQFHDNQPGYFLLTPLKLSDGTLIIIERGWIPSIDNSNPSDWRKYDQPGEVTINGIIRVGISQPEVGGVPDPEFAAGQTRLDFWNNVNLERIGKQISGKLLPVFVQPNPDPAPSVPPYPFQPTLDISEGPHFGYAIQWFTFAALLFFGYPLFIRQQLKKSISESELMETK